MEVFFDKIPIRKVQLGEAELFEKPVTMACPPKLRRRRVQAARRESLDVPAAFPEELIDACVLELYFPEEALEKDLQFITNTGVCLEKTIGLESEASIRELIGHCAVRNLGEKLNRLESDSLSACDAQAGPDLFAVIKQEGKV